MLSREEAHELVDRIFEGEAPKLGILGDGLIEPSEGGTEEAFPDAPPRVLPEGKKVVRTKGSGDRVYLIDEVAETRQWVTNEKVLAGLGFEFGDVGEIEDDELTKYRMAPALYRVNE